VNRIDDYVIVRLIVPVIVLMDVTNGEFILILSNELFGFVIRGRLNRLNVLNKVVSVGQLLQTITMLKEFVQWVLCFIDLNKLNLLMVGPF
jgi:hypothetical protein